MPPARPRRRPRAVHVLRTLLAVSAILPGLLAGAALLVVTRNRRRAINGAVSLWGTLGTLAAGIRLEVEGAEHLERHRPVVFILNHQSGIDPILACALIRHDFVAVAKQEVRRNPVLGPAFAFAGVAFVDRADRAQALRALSPALDVLASGLSIAVAPEGTRGDGDVLGPFKKGAFRIAMAAGVPIVPIVIHNAGDVLPRGAWIMTPATVRVAVLPPIPTYDWKLERLDAHIEAVHERYRQVLAA
ncbi:MAG: 1-acyl-sn-glycerol-3-phosphate acyltransferase [Deltaproteobacteria bacterium]|nr:MAG: 1-acyl-sn-glycerol-3-phosphate acyltransferase [Deltaproteobacteria bacterium]